MILLSLLLSVQLALPQTVSYCPLPHRSRTAVQQFKNKTGYRHGRPGYIVDHKIPLCACGVDNPSNMQWQRKDSAARKDILEKRQCDQLRKLTKQKNNSVTNANK